MEDKRLKEMMDKLSIPEPDEKVREETLRAAMAVFRAQTEKKQEEIKGSSWLGRLMGKKTKGGNMSWRWSSR